MVELSQEERSQIALFERGKRLYELTFAQGWDDVLDVMEQLAIEAEADLLNSKSSDPHITMALQKRANAYRSFFHRFQVNVNEAIRIAREIPLAAIQVPLPGSDEGLDSSPRDVV